jgi:hypothetical protein
MLPGLQSDLFVLGGGGCSVEDVDGVVRNGGRAYKPVEARLGRTRQRQQRAKARGSAAGSHVMCLLPMVKASRACSLH